MADFLVERSERGVVTLTLNRPRRKNAIPGTLWEPLRQVFQEVRNDPNDRVLVVTGAGGAFCAGADLSASDTGGEQSHPIHSMQVVNACAQALHDLNVPSIAKVRGDAVGAGMNLALGCDLVVASENARFSEVFARRALSLDFGGSWLLPRLVGLHKAKELALFAEILDAKQASELGLVNRVVPDAELDAFVDDWADRLAAGPPLALQLSKRLLNDGLTSSLGEALSAEASAQSVNLTSQDTREGVAAFLEKREPAFEGR
ncbi:MAG: enoyl-CoA hydratase/isomerase family protein [Myxococcota bacterium]